MRPKAVLYLLIFVFLISAGAFLFWNINANTINFHLPRRAVKLLALCVTGCAIAVSTSLFQTVSSNNILTPSILGLDSLYLLIQTMLVFFFGSGKLMMMSSVVDYFISMVIMILFSLVLFSFLLGRRNISLSLVLLLGLMLGQLFGGLSTFFQLLIDPNEFLTVQARMFASFNTVNASLLYFSTALVGGLLLVLVFHLDTLDVLSLGKEMAINLGVNYQRASQLLLILVAVLTAIATALVGPVTFLGLLVVSLSRQLTQTYRHSQILVTSSLLSMIFLVFGQFLVERVFLFSTPISVIINFLGGIYFLSLLITRGKA